MAIEHPKPTESTVKFLYAHAFRCAYKGCRRPLYTIHNQTGDRTLNSRICHIHARREGGPRWDPQQSAEDNRSERNLIVMCVEHASLVDEQATLSSHSAERLQEWKAQQLEEYDRLKQGWELDTNMAREAIDASFSNVEVVITQSTVNLSGEGGRAPCAGGGGGGAIGRNSRGGRGGDGGGHRIDEGEFTLPWVEDASRPRLMEVLRQPGFPPDFNPGAGGGGAGAVGDGSIGGDGGGGGERVSAQIDIAKLREAGLDRIEYVVGKGGLGSRLPGQLGEKGEDTAVNFIAKDGTILKTIRAAGGAATSRRLPEGAVELSLGDIDNGFRVTTLMPVNAAEVRDGLLFVLGGGWKIFRVPHVPVDATWIVVCTARWRALEGMAPRAIFLSLIHPAGHEVSCQTLPCPIPPEAIQDGDCHWIAAIGAAFDTLGQWTLRAHSGGFLLAEVNVVVQFPH
jgi:hypothetical protein